MTYQEWREAFGDQANNLTTEELLEAAYKAGKMYGGALVVAHTFTPPQTPEIYCPHDAVDPIGYCINCGRYVDLGVK